MEQIKAVKTLLQYPKDVVILSHRNPDGDAMGSTTALSLFLQRHGHNTKIIVPSEFPEFLEWLPESDRVLVFDNDPAASIKAIQKSELIFLLDFNSLDRIDKLADSVEKQSVPKIMIDHHLFPEPIADYLFSDTTASSTCEMVFDFMEALDCLNDLDPVLGDCLLTGMLTDTGSFKYSTSPKLFRIVAELLDRGVDDYRLQDLIFNSMGEKQLRLLGHCLANRMEVLPEYRAAIIWLTQEDYVDFDIKRGDTEGIVNYLLRMRRVKIAAFIHEQPTIVKLSLRSKGDVDVQEIAKKHFRGGGHKNAAGGASFASLSSTIKRFKGLLPEYQAMLSS